MSDAKKPSLSLVTTETPSARLERARQALNEAIGEFCLATIEVHLQAAMSKPPAFTAPKGNA